MASRPITYAEVDLGAIAANIRRFKQHAQGARLIAVVKANAYGHGMLPVAYAVLRAGADMLAVARVEEGAALRAGGVTGAPVLVMTYTPPERVDIALQNRLTLAVGDWDVIQAYQARASALGQAVTIHIKVDTGMGRFGFLPHEVAPVVDQLKALPPGLDLEGLFTHFAVADDPTEAGSAYTHRQFEAYMDVWRALEAAGHHIRLRHVANSAATLLYPEMHLDAVRPGISIYGLTPDEPVPLPFPLRPALTLKSRVARVRTLPAGSSISYGRTYTTIEPTPVALVPVGYGDGYARQISNQGGAVLVRGQRAPLVGRVCMDQFVVDVSDIPDVQRDDEVVIVGAQGQARISAEEVARLAGTINYTVVTGLLPRARRVYV